MANIDGSIHFTVTLVATITHERSIILNFLDICVIPIYFDH